jgi:hypothetical protein
MKQQVGTVRGEEGADRGNERPDGVRGMPEPDTLPPVAEMRDRAHRILEAHWRPAGYCVPNGDIYPFQWLWDSCFHAIVWAHLGEGDQALAELTHVFRSQDPSGFVPHIDYEAEPDHHRDVWGRSGASAITQPPMYGHAVAELARLGLDVPDELIDKAGRGLHFLLHQRRRDSATGLVTVVHPWETGADNSPRWDDWCGDAFTVPAWHEAKGALLRTIEYGPTGAPLANPAFAVAPVNFNALVAFNASELASLNGDDELASEADELARSLAARWDPTLRTWVDAGARPARSGAVRTVDALLPWLVADTVDTGVADQVSGQLIDPSAFGGRFGPAGVHRDEPVFEPDTYWRGSAWPQLTYLFWVAARRHGYGTAASALAAGLTGGAWASGFAEHWHPDDARPLGASPQSWSTLAAVVTDR